MQVATLFRESATLLGAASMMDSATSSSLSTASTTATTTVSAPLSPSQTTATVNSPGSPSPLQAQSPPQLLQTSSTTEVTSLYQCQVTTEVDINSSEEVEMTSHLISTPSTIKSPTTEVTPITMSTTDSTTTTTGSNLLQCNEDAELNQSLPMSSLQSTSMVAKSNIDETTSTNVATECEMESPTLSIPHQSMLSSCVNEEVESRSHISPLSPSRLSTINSKGSHDENSIPSPTLDESCPNESSNEHCEMESSCLPPNHLNNEDVDMDNTNSNSNINSNSSSNNSNNVPSPLDTEHHKTPTSTTTTITQNSVVSNVNGCDSNNDKDTDNNNSNEVQLKSSEIVDNRNEAEKYMQPMQQQQHEEKYEQIKQQEHEPEPDHDHHEDKIHLQHDQEDHFNEMESLHDCVSNESIQQQQQQQQHQHQEQQQHQHQHQEQQQHHHQQTLNTENNLTLSRIANNSPSPPISHVPIDVMNGQIERHLHLQQHHHQLLQQHHQFHPYHHSNYHDAHHLTGHEQLQLHNHHSQHHLQQQQQHEQEQHHMQLQQHYHLPFHQQGQDLHMQQQRHRPMTCIDELMIDDNHDDPTSRYKLLSPNGKHESQDDGYETSAGDVLTPSSHASSHSMTPQHQMHSGVILSKCEIPPPPSSSVDDPYNFIDDELNNSIQLMSPSSNGGPLGMRQQGYPHHPTGPPLSSLTQSMVSGSSSGGGGTASQLISIDNVIGSGTSGHNNGSQIIGHNRIHDQGISEMNGPKKRGRKKKIRDENGSMMNGILKPVIHKERKKHDRFNGMPEEEVSKRTIPDHLANNLDIIIIGINPGLFAAYKGHHYAGPGNHFWKCLYLSGLTREQMTAEEDYKLLDFGIGFTNMVKRATKGSADLTRKEIKEGCRILLEKLRKFRPKIAVFNGKLIFEVFSGKKDFNFGRQPECIEGTNTYMWVMPSSSARCAQLPRAADKVPFYAALKKFRDYLNGLIPHIEESECVFSDPKYKQCCEPEPKSENLGYTDITDLTNCNLPGGSGTLSGSQQLIQKCNNNDHGNELIQPGKKKRGRPKKIKGLDNCEDNKLAGALRLTQTDNCRNNNGLNLSNLNNCNMSEIPKKKRGRPKKIKTGDILSGGTNDTTGLGIIGGTLLNGSSKHSNNNGMTNGLEGINNPDMNHNSPNGGMSNLCGNLNQQQQQQQRLFSPPMHSPSTVGSYCPIGINSSTPPINNNNNNNNSNGYHHHQQHTRHQLGNVSHHHHAAHQSYHQASQQQQQQQTPPQQYTPHSDLSSEISAAISSEHLGESPTPTSPSLGPPDFDPPGSIQADDTNPNDLRFSSPASTISEQQQSVGPHISGNGHLSGYSSYRNPGSNNSYMSTSGGSSNDGHGNDNYIQSQSSTQTQQQQTSQQQQQQTTSNNGQSLQISDVASKSLSGLESLVDQIPTMTDNDGTSTPISTSSDNRLCDPNDQYPNNCLYSNYQSNIQQLSSSSSPSPVTANNSNNTTNNNSNNNTILSPHHYTNPNFSNNSIVTNCTTSNSSSTYGSLSSNFSVSSLTSSNYPSSSSYHANLMATSPPHHHLTTNSGSSSTSPMYMEPHIPVPVNPLYHPYTQHSGYGSYSPVGPPPPPPPTLHMPSPNYPYGYGNAGAYPPTPTHHHPSHQATAAAAAAAAAGYLSNHPSMFDRLKPDIGYGGF